jgi:NADH-quinone oxidoreductase subunit N
MAYSSIAHAGYLLIGVTVALATAAGEASTAKMGGAAAAIFYLAVYAAATLGVFAALAYLAGQDRELDSVNELAGLSKSQPLVALAMATCLFSLTGVPPFAGFWGKLSLLAGALWFDPNTVDPATRHWFLALVIVGAINAAISAGYYLRLVGAMYFRPADKTIEPTGGRGPLWAATAAALLVVVMGIMPGILVRQSDRAAEPISNPALIAASHGDGALALNKP